MTMSVEHETFVIERRLAATPAEVFAAFAEPAIKDRWFVKSSSWPIAEYRHDFRVGGREHGRFSPDGTTIIINDTTYLDIVAGARIVSVYAMAFEGEPPFSASLTTTTLAPDGNGTRLVYCEQAAFFDGKDTAEKREAGCRWLIDNLEQEVARGAATR